MKRFVPVVYFLCVCICLCQSLYSEDFRPPNIVVILADDFGVGDIQAHYPENQDCHALLGQVRSGVNEFY